jgi:hypothetical protein
VDEHARKRTDLEMREGKMNRLIELRDTLGQLEAIVGRDVIPSCAEADSDLGFPNGGKSDSMLFFIWRT